MSNYICLIKKTTDRDVVSRMAKVIFHLASMHGGGYIFLMSRIRWHILPTVLVVLSVILVWTVAVLAPGLPDLLRWSLFGAGALALASIFGFRRRERADEAALEAEREALKEEQNRFRELRDSFENEVEKRSRLLQKKEMALAQKLATFHEWMEFPLDLDGDAHAEPVSPDIQEKDQEVLKLLKHRTDGIFDKIKNRDYLDAGEFQRDRLFRDIHAIMEDVARIYNPDSANPLLETSVEKLLRAINRIALQLLVLLEQMPIDFKRYNIRSMYDTIQAGVRAYNTYKTALPYWNYLRPVYYVGRFSLGSNPLTLGVTWALGELATRGVQKFSTHLTNRYALGFLYDMVFIVGSETAGVFGGDFRHRELSWIYGAELTELIRRFPVSRETLLRSMNEVGNLPLRSEYDRIFLYRCLAAHKSARPEKFDPRSFLPIQDRQTIAEKLEQFYLDHFRQSEGDADAWMEGIEDRLGIKLRTGGAPQLLLPPVERAADALRSLASFLMDVKKQPSETLPVHLPETRMITRLNEDRRRREVEQLMAAPPMIFDYPDLASGEELLEDYIQDLADLCVRLHPHDPACDTAVESVARYFRYDLKTLKKRLDGLYTAYFTEKLIPESPEKHPRPHAVRGLLSSLEPEEFPLFLYKGISIRTAKGERISFPKDINLWLMGTGHRLLLVGIPAKDRSPEQEAALLWEGFRGGEGAASAAYMESRFGDDCLLTGGVWHWSSAAENEEPAAIKISGSSRTRAESFFRPVFAFCGEIGLLT